MREPTANGRLLAADDHLSIRFLCVVLSRSIRRYTVSNTTPEHLARQLEPHRYMNLTTFRKNGEPVVVPVWFAARDNKLYVFSGVNTGKIKRIRNNPAVLVAPSNATGKQLGPALRGTARIIDGSEAEAADQLILRKYGWQKRFFAWVNHYRGKIGEAIFIEITLANA